MAIHWQIKFKAIRSGTDYTVNIYDGSYSGTPLQLKGGAQPFSTQEDNNEDMFTPVRTQTGYIRIVDDGWLADGVTAFDWHGMIPETDLSRPVTLTAGGSVVWQGYMQAQTFGSVLYGNPQEREFPIQCPLSSLSANDIDKNERQLRNFAYVIKKAFDTIAGTTINNYIFQGGASARTWLMKLIDWQNYIMSSDDGLTGKYDYLRVIDDICKYWGWTCRIYGQDVIFSCVDDTTLPGVLTLTQAQLNTLAGGTSAGSVGDSFLSNISLSGDIFASVDNQDYLVRGYSKAMVSADGNPAETKVIGFAPASVEKEMKGRGTYSEADGSKIVTYSNDLATFTSEYITGGCRNGYATFNIAQIQERQNTEADNSADVIRIKKSFSSTSADAYASLITVFHHSYYDINNGGALLDGGLYIKGKIYLKATLYEDAQTGGLGAKTMYMRLGIGTSRSNALWWNGTTWSSTVSAFQVAVGGDGDELLCKVSSGGVTTYKNITTNEQYLFGLVFVEFLGSSDIPETSGERSFDIHDFSVEFVRTTIETLASEPLVSNRFGNFGGARKTRVIDRAGVREYVAKNTNKARSDWNADCIYASDNDMEFGYGVILNTDGTQMGKQTYGSQSQFPEQHLADRVANYWAAAKRKMDVELRSNVIGTITPRNIVTFDGTTCTPVAISYEWRDCITRLTLLQKS